MKVIIIGGVAGGASAAARLRRLDEKAEITVYERSGFVSYANCGLPYYVGGVITDKSELTLKTPESFKTRFDIDIKVLHEVTAIDTAKKTVTVRDIKGGLVFEDSYDKLILSPGAKASLPPFEVPASDRIFTLRTVEDSFATREFIEIKKPASAIVLGGGFIGLEMAENLTEAGIKTTVVELAPHLLKTFDGDMASMIHACFRKNGVDLVLGTGASGIAAEGEKIALHFSGKPDLNADMLILALGVTPDTELAKKAGLSLGSRGSILVNDRMETSAKDVYAVGDAVEVRYLIAGNKALISLAGPANKQGRIAADNACGGSSTYGGSMGASVIKIFDMTAASVGLTQEYAETLGFDSEAIIISSGSHASYYPGARNMWIKAIFERGTNRILGAQIVGYEGVDKRIDVIAASIKLGASIIDLKDLELAYAPPYSSAKDPVNVIGLIAENVATGKFTQFHVEDIDALPRDGSVTLLDARTPAEYEKGHIDGFINIQLDELRDRLTELPEGKPVYINCQSGLRSYIACRMLTQYGFECHNLAGGYGFYNAVKTERLAAESSWPCGMEK
ncbi:MAG: FAD-dependent oxidoreductase [Oscillospiraceae bacterium]|nr:FAD-dependent oxidoreductase [Oscillospiraceae bacterium]